MILFPTTPGCKLVSLHTPASICCRLLSDLNSFISDIKIYGLSLQRAKRFLISVEHAWK